MLKSFRKKLSTAWESASNKGAIYSHVFEYGSRNKTERWMKALPIEGTSPPDYKLYLCASNLSDRAIEGIYTLNAAISYIKSFEKDSLKDRLTMPARKQPFKRHIQTALVMPPK